MKLQNQIEMQISSTDLCTMVEYFLNEEVLKEKVKVAIIKPVKPSSSSMSDSPARYVVSYSYQGIGEGA